MSLSLIFICFVVVFNNATVPEVIDEPGKNFELLGTGCLDKNNAKPICCDITEGNTLTLAQCKKVCLESPRCLSIEYKPQWGCRLFFGVLEHTWRLEFEKVGNCTHPESKETIIPTEVSKAVVETCDVNGEPCCYKHIEQEFPEMMGEFYLFGLDACGRGKSRYLDSSNIDGVLTAEQCANIATEKKSLSFSWASGEGVGRCRVHSQAPSDLYSEWRWDWVCYTTNNCEEKQINHCVEQRKLPCSAGPSNECGDCLPGYKPIHYTKKTTKCIDVCNTKAKLKCNTLHRHSCESLSEECGECEKGFKPVEGKDGCVEIELVTMEDNVCDIKAQAICIGRHRTLCQRGTEECGSCIDGWIHDPNTKKCIDVCTPKRRRTCGEFNRQHCLPHDKECGGCRKGFKEIELKDGKGKCVDVCDNAAKKYCHETFQLECKSGTTKCGMCKHGYYRHNGDCRKKINDRKYWGFDDCKDEGKFFDVGRSLTVRCCSNKNVDAAVGKFELESVTCVKKNYHEAVEWCEAQNRRLCTREQLESSTSCTRFRLMGCNFDSAYTWTNLHDWGCPAVGGYKNGALKYKSNIPTIEACFDFCETVVHEGHKCKAIDYSHDTKLCRALKYTYKHAHDPTLENNVVANRHGHCPSTIGKTKDDDEVVASPNSNWGCLVLGQSNGERISTSLTKTIYDCFDFCESITSCSAVSYDIRTKECHALQGDYKDKYDEQSDKMILANRWDGCADQKPATYEDIVKDMNIEEIDVFVNERTAKDDLPNLYPIMVGAGQESATHTFFESTSFHFALVSIGCVIASYSGYLYGQKRRSSENVYIEI